MFGPVLAGFFAFAAALPDAAVAAGTAPAAVESGETAGAAVGTGEIVAHAVRVDGNAQRTRLVVDLSESVDLEVFTLADPPRIVIDLPAMRFAFPEGTGRQARGLITAFRYGAFVPGRARIVIDVSEPVALDKAFVLPAVADQPARMVLDLVRTDKARFLAAQSESLARMRALDARYARKSRSRELSGQAGGGQRKDGKLPLIVLDPGHGGIDGGTIGASGTIEKAVVLDFARVLKKKLEETKHFRVRMTRTDDTFVSLGERVRMARSWGARLFISLHVDSLADARFRGATVYTLSEKASDAVARALAEKENRADSVAGISWPRVPNEVGDILTELMQRETRIFSTVFARKVVEEFRSAIKLVRNPHRSAGFFVLESPDVPSILIELGYLSNPLDEKMLTSQEWRERTANAIAEAVRSFFSQRIAQRP